MSESTRMVRVVSSVPTTSEEVNGVRFVRLGETVAVSEELPEDHPEVVRFTTRLPGFRVAEDGEFDPATIEKALADRRSMPTAREEEAKRTQRELAQANRAMSDDLRKSKDRIAELEGALEAGTKSLREENAALAARVASLEAENAGLVAQLAAAVSPQSVSTSEELAKLQGGADEKPADEPAKVDEKPVDEPAKVDEKPAKQKK